MIIPTFSVAVLDLKPIMLDYKALGPVVSAIANKHF